MNSLMNRPIWEGHLANRINFSHCERGFVEEWKNSYKWLDDIIGREASRDDYWVAASVFQWLGTNVGFSAISKALQFSGNWIHCEPYPKPVMEAHSEPLLKSMAEITAEVEWESRRCKASHRAAQMLFDLSEPN